jgi:hypothetical protein
MQLGARFNRLRDSLLLRVIALCRQHDCVPCFAGAMRLALFFTQQQFLV